MSTGPSRYHALKVRSVVGETHDSKSIVFDIPAADAASFRYKPGQFLTLRLPIAGRHVPRCYSMASAPALDDGLRVTLENHLAGHSDGHRHRQCALGHCHRSAVDSGRHRNVQGLGRGHNNGRTGDG